MGRDNNNAGIHLLPRGYNGSTDSIDEYDKYSSIIADQLDRPYRFGVNSIPPYKSVFTDIEVCNFITLWNTRGESNRCLCGCTPLKFNGKVYIKYHKNNKMENILIPAKQCPDCGRIFAVKSIIMKELNK